MDLSGDDFRDDSGASSGTETCSVCLRRRPVSVDGSTHPLPLSGDSVTKRLSNWRCYLRPYFDSAFEVLSRVKEDREPGNFPVCSPCLELILDVERVEFVFKNFCEILWRRSERDRQRQPAEEQLPASETSSRYPRRRSAAPPGFYAEYPFDVAVNVDCGVDGALPKEEIKRELIKVKDIESILRKTVPEPEPGVPPAEVGSILISRRSLNGSHSTVKSLTSKERQQLQMAWNVPRPLLGRPPFQRASRAKHEDGVRMALFAGRKITLALPKRQTKGAKSTGTGSEVSSDVADDGGVVRKKRGRKPKPKGVESTPSEPRESICPICGIIIKGENFMLKKHIKTVHEKVATIKCHYCDEKFCYYKNLYAHEAKVHNHSRVRKKHQCDLCGKIITERWGMRTHLLSMHGIIPKDTNQNSVRECERCGKKFLCPTKFKDHMNMHDNIRPYGCPLCDVRMVKFANLQQHSKRLHGRALTLDHDPVNTNGCKLVDDRPVDSGPKREAGGVDSPGDASCEAVAHSSDFIVDDSTSCSP